MLGIVILAAVFIYQAIPASYTYLNRYLVMKKTSGRSMAALKGLDIVKNWYDFTSNLIMGRSTLIVMASLLGWLAEVITLKALASWKLIAFGWGDFASYIEEIFMNENSALLTMYTGAAAAAFLVLTLLGYGIKWIFDLRKDSV